MLVMVAGLFIAGYVFDLGDYLRSARGWIASLGGWGPAAFIVLYVVGAIAMVPGAALRC